MPRDAVLVGIVDSGCRPDQRGRVDQALAFAWDGERVQAMPVADDRLGHGSALLEVMALLAPQARFAVAQVFRHRLATRAVQVAAAVDWLVEAGSDVINLSLGLPTDRTVLADACARAVAAGVIVCAASPARGAPVYPAAYPGVLRATGDARCGREELSHLGTRHADFGGHVRPLHGGLSGAGASVGCAHITALLAHYLTAGGEPGPAAASRWLKRQARYHGPERRTG
jgi:hypothetical protein